jgi:hypothetical protein
MRKSILILAVVGVLAGIFFFWFFTRPANAPESGSAAGSGVIGTVNLGPTCPVERIPPMPGCAPRPYQTSIQITKDGNSSFRKLITSDLDGRFKVDLLPGTYQFSAKGGAVMPRCSPVSAEVKANSFASLIISCDTGIR